MKRSIALAVALSFLALGVPAIAGTTGGLNGTVTDTNKVPVAGAKVTATSPSQLATAVTDAQRPFCFRFACPGRIYALHRNGYDSGSYPGIAVFADAQQTLSLTLRKALTTIANVTSRSASNLVRSGTTADLYSVNSAQQERVAGLGGGGNLNSAYSAISTVPGAYVPANQSGYNQAVHVRGRRLVRGRVRVRRHPGESRFRQLPVGLALVTGTTRTASLYRRDAFKRRSSGPSRVHQ